MTEVPMNSTEIYSNITLHYTADYHRKVFNEITLSTRVCLAVSIFLLGLVAIVGNTLLLLTLILTRRLRTVNSCFLINLAFSDLFLAALLPPMILVNLFNSNHHVFSKISCSALGFLLNILYKVSTLSVAAIAFDRHQAIVNCLEYSTTSTYSYVIKGLIWIWIQALTLSLLPLLGWSEYSYEQYSFLCTVNWNKDISYTISMLLLCLVGPLCVMSYCYIRIIQIARRHMRRIADINTQVRRTDISQLDPNGILALAMVDPIQKISLFPHFKPGLSGSVHSRVDLTRTGFDSRENHCNPPEGDNISSASVNIYPGPNLRREAKATLRLVGMILIVLISWLPYFLTVTKDAINDRLGRRNSSGTAITATTWLLLISCALNPVLYAFGSKKFRSAVKRLWRKRKGQLVRMPLQKQTSISHKVEKAVSISFNPTGKSKSMPSTTSKTCPATDSDHLVIVNSGPPVMVLSPVGEVTSPRISSMSNLSHLDLNVESLAMKCTLPRKLPPLSTLGTPTKVVSPYV